LRTAWRVNGDRTQATLRGRLGTVQIAGAGRRPSRRTRARRNGILKAKAMEAFALLPQEAMR